MMANDTRVVHTLYRFVSALAYVLLFAVCFDTGCTARRCTVESNALIVNAGTHVVFPGAMHARFGKVCLSVTLMTLVQE